MMSGTIQGGDARREERWLRATEGWARLLLRLFPVDFRDDMGEAFVGAYRDRSRAALRRAGLLGLAGIWLTALADSARNGVGERVNPGISWRRGGNWGRDTERVMRRLVRAPMFALTMVGTLAIGLGAFAVVATVVHKVLLAPLPYSRPDDLYFAWRDYTWVPFERGWMGGTDVAALEKAGGAIADVAGIQGDTETLTSGAGGAGAADAEEVRRFIATPNVFDLLGVRPILGRGFAANEGGPGRPPVLVMSHGLWQRRFGGDRGIVGQEVRLDGDPFTVIGVMGPEFAFVRNESEGAALPADVWTTFDVDLATTNPNGGSYAALIRARPGSTIDAVRAAVDAVAKMVDARDFRSRGMRFQTVSLHPDLVARVRPALTVLGVAGVFLLLVLAVNLATLLLVRAAHREREFAISRALGANRVALVRATILEAGVLGALGGAVGVLLAVWGTRGLVALAPLDLPRREAIAVDWPMAALVVGLGALLGLLAGAAPATWATRASLSSLLSNAAVRGGGGGHGGMRRGLVVAQVALSLVLLSAGGLVVRSFERLLRVDPGFEPAGVLTLRVPVSGEKYPDTTAVRLVHERLLRDLAAIPGVRVGATSALPLTANANQSSIAFPGAPGNSGDDDKDTPLVDYMAIRGDVLETLGTRVIAGRGFGPTRTPGHAEVLIDRTLAAQFFPGGNAVGATARFSGDTVVVVGVVEHARQVDVHEDGRQQLYYRHDDLLYGTMFYALRGDRTAWSLAPDVQATIRRIDPGLPIADLRPMEDVVSDSLRQQRVSAVLIAGFALGALLLAAMGLFGIVSGSVNRRQHELAVRLALGADHRRVLRLVLGEGALLIGLGLLVGLPGVYLAGRLIGGILVGVSPYDVPTLLAVAAGLAAVALLACWVPARRVAGIEPAASLREG
jgi:putative ABC transport system permease protein